MLLLLGAAARAQDHGRGRRYKAPPETAHVVVSVLKSTNGKPVINAAVVFHAVLDGKDQGNLEVKTDPDGKATIDLLPIGSKVLVQVIADGYATFADEYAVPGAEREITIRLRRPQEQVSAYVDSSGKAAGRKPGVQEPIRLPAAAVPPPVATPKVQAPADSAPPVSDSPAGSSPAPRL